MTQIFLVVFLLRLTAHLELHSHVHSKPHVKFKHQNSINFFNHFNDWISRKDYDLFASDLTDKNNNNNKTSLTSYHPMRRKHMSRASERISNRVVRPHVLARKPPGFCLLFAPFSHSQQTTQLLLTFRWQTTSYGTHDSIIGHTTRNETERPPGRSTTSHGGYSG